jgi:NAD(P)-dependent dehydrogenase (short-subunit alcohol dehydrogenase family)
LTAGLIRFGGEPATRKTPQPISRRKLRTYGKTALITGVTGQYGACLAELLLGQGHTVHGIKRRGGLFSTDRVVWQPFVGFSELVTEMMCEDLRHAQRDGVLNADGFLVREPHE